jgi:hypothetical protein
MKKNKEIIQNDYRINSVKNEVVKQAAQTIFNNVISMDNITNIINDITIAITANLKNASFMTENLELTEKQKEKIGNIFGDIATRIKNEYCEKLEKDKRVKKVVEEVENKIKEVAEEVLAGIGAEINRGAILNAAAVKANAASEKTNSIELNYGKYAGDITIPTRGIFISTNCIDVILNSVEVESELEIKTKETETN